MHAKKWASAILLLWSAQAAAQMPHIVGSWQLDVAASDASDRPERVHVRTYVPTDDGFLMGVAVVVDIDGNANFLQFTAKTDGRDYPEYSAGLLAELQATGTPTRASYSETRVDDYTVAWTDKYDGEVYATGTRSVAADGRTMTIVVESRDPEGRTRTRTLVFDRL